MNRAMAIAAHPDDVEFMMAGTLALLKERGWEIHCLNVANGCVGSETLDARTIAGIRAQEARSAAAVIGAVVHPCLTNDIEVFYEKALLAKVASVVREVTPRVILTHYPFDYMEDHSNTARLAVTAAFCRGMPNFPTDPSWPPASGSVTVYHALPYGLRDPLRRLVEPELFVDVSCVMATKCRMLAAHQSQKDWLTASQGMGAYIHTMEAMARDVGRLSGRFEYAEGWIRHLHLGLCAEQDNPLREALPPDASCMPAGAA